MSKRRFWQIHLSTAILLMFASAILMFLNFVERTNVFTREREVETITETGWPIAYSWVSWIELDSDGMPAVAMDLNLLFASVNIIACLLVLLLVWWAAEFFISRKP